MSFTAFDPRTGRPGTRTFEDASAREIAGRVAAATATFQETRRYSGRRIGEVLRSIADELTAAGEAIVEVAERETALGRPRLTSEVGRITAQFQLFGALCEEGSYVSAVIDHARPEATPPGPDLRRMLVPLGPVAVFGASNFPLAFSVPGGDTASALAARCPVVFKAHPSHPETSEVCAAVIREGLRRVDAPEAMLAIVHGRGTEVGRALVLEPDIRAVGFTGSLRGGTALYQLAAGRDEPIPVYAEMGSVNPLFVTEAALAGRLEELATGFLGSMTMGSGQFCTKPGLAFVPDGELGLRWAETVAAGARRLDPGYLLNQAIRDAVAAQLERTGHLPEVEILAGGKGTDGPGFRYPTTVLSVDAAAFRQRPELHEEHFGPAATIVRYGALDDLLELARLVPPSLTASLHAEEGEVEALRELVELLEQRAGRLVWNGYPTGVAVTHAMVHGGPYPATTIPLHTSVGSAAINRFLRPVAFQSYPQPLLPEELRDGNPLGIARMVDGEWTLGPIRDRL